jgi:peptidoglycan-associated lipoprotein
MSTRAHLNALSLLTALACAACGSSATDAQRSTTARNQPAATSQARPSPRAATAGNLDAAGTGCRTEAVYYGFDSSDLDQSARRTLADNADCIKRTNRAAAIVGMTDPRGTEEYNLALGERRASTAVRYMTSLGVEQDRLRTVTLGEERAEGSDETGWARDRRADVNAN